MEFIRVIGNRRSALSAARLLIKIMEGRAVLKITFPEGRAPERVRIGFTEGGIGAVPTDCIDIDTRKVVKRATIVTIGEEDMEYLPENIRGATAYQFAALSPVGADGSAEFEYKSLRMVTPRGRK